MKNFTFFTVGLILVLFLVRPSVAGEESWQVLQGIQATPMNPEEIEAVQGKDINWDFYKDGGFFNHDPDSGVTIGVWSTDPAEITSLGFFINGIPVSFSFNN